MAHKSEDQTLVNAYKNNLDLHKQTASKLFNKTEELVTKDERYIGKLGISRFNTAWVNILGVIILITKVSRWKRSFRFMVECLVG